MRWFLLSNKRESNQAEKLQQLFTEITNQENVSKQEKNDVVVEEMTTYKEIDVLNLPPRSEVHKKLKWRLKIRFGAPIVRFSLFVLILLIIVALVLYVYIDSIPFLSFLSI